MTFVDFPGNIRPASEPAGYTLLTPAGHALLVHFLAPLILASRRCLLAEIDAVLALLERHDEAGDVAPWQQPADWWKGERDDL